MRMGTTWLLIAAVFACVHAVGRQAAAYPVERANSETPVAWAQEVISVGPWSIDGNRLELPATDRSRNLRLAPGPADGFLRLRIDDTTDSRFLLLFRTEVAGRRPLRMRGYGLAVNSRKGDVLFYRFDEGGARDSGVRRDVAELIAAGALEVCLWFQGSTFVATVFDGVTKQELASLSWSDDSYADGAVGVQLAGRADRGAQIRLTTQTPGPTSSAPRAWIAREWLVTMEPETVPLIPEPLRLQLRSTRASPEGEASFATDERTVVALREQGVPLQGAQPGVPFAYRYAGTFQMPTDVRDTRQGIAYVDGLKPPEVTLAHLRAFHRRFPQRTRLELLGRTGEGRELLALRIADDPDDTTRPTVLLVAAHHGNEAVTPEMVLDAVRYLLERRDDPRVATWLSTLTVVAVPIVNVDGNYAFWHRSDQLGRTNRRPTTPEEPRTWGVDLNRNYPFLWGANETRFNNSVAASVFYRGPEPASEPETRAMMTLAEREHFVGALSYHAAATKILVPYSTGTQPNPEPSAAWALAHEMEELLPHRFGRRRYEAARTLYEATGTDHNWHYHRFGTVALLFEAPYSTPVRNGQLRDTLVHSRPAWQYLLDRWIAGPSLSVRTVDGSTGEPMTAIVTLDEVRLGAGERWMTRIDNGWQHQYLPAPGTYTVRARAADRSAVQQVTVLEGVATVELQLSRDSTDLPAAQ